jgi:outer membrane protein OmpA-like peptidoglycan-associated protein
MDFESIFRKASVALVAGAYALFVEAAYVAQAQTRMIAGSPTAGSRTPDVATAERIVIHGVRFRARSDKIEKCSVPVMDYAVQIIKQNPESLIKVRPVQDTSQEYTGRNSKLTNRRTRAVASYFEQRGISANRLILLGSSNAPYTSGHGPDNAQSLKQNFEVVQLDLANGLD